MLARLFRYVNTLSVKDRLSLIRIIVSIGLLSGLLASYKLWINDRFYPLSPVSDLVPVLTAPFDSILFLAVIFLLISITVYPTKYLYGLLFVAAIYLVLQDQSRLQPWVQQYLFLLGTVAWVEVKPNHKRGRAAIISIWIIFIGIYLWSGLHKLNHTYLFETFEWLTGPLFTILPMPSSSLLSVLALGSALLEISAGLMLAFRATRLYGVLILIGMHTFILFMVGPFGLEYNHVVWPWNLIFLFLLPVAFLGVHRNTKSYYPFNLYQGAVIMFFIFLPVLNFVNIWDHFPSHSLYSGKKPYAKLHVTEPVREKFPEVVQAEFDQLNTLSFRDWSYAELTVPDYPQPRIYKNIFRKLCTYQQHKFGLVLEIYTLAELTTGERKRYEYFCHDL